jgi:hypothetical protein
MDIAVVILSNSFTKITEKLLGDLTHISNIDKYIICNYNQKFAINTIRAIQGNTSITYGTDICWDYFITWSKQQDYKFIWCVEDNNEVNITELIHKYKNSNADLLCKDVIHGQEWKWWYYRRNVFSTNGTNKYPDKTSNYKTCSTHVLRFSEQMLNDVHSSLKHSRNAYKDILFRTLCKIRYKSIVQLKYRNQCRTIKKPCDIVVSCFNTDINWVLKIIKLTSYNVNAVYFYYKGDLYFQKIIDKLKEMNIKHYIVKLPNIGRCDHTYLYHIVNEWNSLPRYTMFLKDTTYNCYGYDRKNRKKRRILHPKIEEWAIKRATNQCYAELGNCDTTFKLKRYNSVAYKTHYTESSYDNLQDFTLKVLGHKLPGKIGTQYSGVFIVSYQNIIRTNYKVYKILSEQFLGNNCEVGHFMERLWFFLFNTGIKKL